MFCASSRKKFTRHSPLDAFILYFNTHWKRALNDFTVNELVLEIQRFLVKPAILASHSSKSMTSLLFDPKISKLLYFIPLVLKKNGIECFFDCFYRSKVIAVLARKLPGWLTFECESGATNVKLEPSILSYVRKYKKCEKLFEFKLCMIF